MSFDTDFLDTGSPVGAIVYLALNLGLTAWSRRAALKQGGRAAGVALLDVLGNASLSIPALAYWNAGITARLGDWLLRLLFVLGMIALLGFAGHDTRAALDNPRVDPRRRRKFAIVTACAMLLPSAPEVWWGASALAHVHA